MESVKTRKRSMTPADLAAHKEEIVDGCKALINSHVMSISEHGNVSARVRPNVAHY